MLFVFWIGQKRQLPFDGFFDLAKGPDGGIRIAFDLAVDQQGYLCG